MTCGLPLKGDQNTKYYNNLREQFLTNCESVKFHSSRRNSIRNQVVMLLVCDGAFSPSDESAVFAVLVRDSGAVVEIYHARIKVSSALATKAWAIQVAVVMTSA